MNFYYIKIVGCDITLFNGCEKLRYSDCWKKTLARDRQRKFRYDD